MGFQNGRFHFGISLILCEYCKRQIIFCLIYFLNLRHRMYTRFKNRTLLVFFILPQALSCKYNLTDVPFARCKQQEDPNFNQRFPKSTRTSIPKQIYNSLLHNLMRFHFTAARFTTAKLVRCKFITDLQKWNKKKGLITQNPWSAVQTSSTRVRKICKICRSYETSCSKF